MSRLEITHIDELVGNVLNVDVTSLDGLQDVLLRNTATRSDRSSDSETYSLVETMTIPPMLGWVIRPANTRIILSRLLGTTSGMPSV